MKQKPWFKSMALLAVTVLVAVGFFALLFHYDNKYTARAEIVQDRTVFVQEGQLLSPIYLADGWELWPDALLTPAELTDHESQALRTFIGEYLNLAPLHADRSPYGEATWRLHLRYDGPPTDAALLLPEVFCAWKLYVNGKELAGQGSLSPYRPLVRDTVVSFPLEQDTELVVQTANESHYYSGLTYPPVLGTAQAVQGLVGARLIYYGFLCFGALVAALFSLALWLGVKKNRDPVALLFGTLALGFTLWVSYPFSRFFGVPLVRPLYALEDAAWLLVIWCALRITLRLCGLSQVKWARVLSRLAFSILVLGVLVPLALLPVLPAFSIFYGKLITAYRLLSALTLVALSLYGTSRGREHAPWLLCGTAFYGAALLAGALTVSHFEPARFGWPEEYGALALVVCFGVLMVRRGFALVRENLRLNEHLREEVAKKTREIGLMVSEREDLVAKFLHDMKSPAASLRSYARMTRENNVQLDQRTREQLQVVEEKCGVIAQRAQLAQQYTTENPLITPHEKLDLCEFLRAFYQSNKPDVEMDGQSLLLRTQSGICPVLANPDKLNRLLQNLVYNALHFTPSDGKVRLSLRWDDDTALLQVEDTGSGIAPEVLPHVFDRFFTTRKEDGGTGMGLYIARTIAREHGGEVSVQSTMGVGTIFTIRLPLL